MSDRESYQPPRLMSREVLQAFDLELIAEFENKFGDGPVEVDEDVIGWLCDQMIEQGEGVDKIARMLLRPEQFRSYLAAWEQINARWKKSWDNYRLPIAEQGQKMQNHRLAWIFWGASISVLAGVIIVLLGGTGPSTTPLVLLVFAPLMISIILVRMVYDPKILRLQRQVSGEELHRWYRLAEYERKGCLLDLWPEDDLEPALV